MLNNFFENCAIGEMIWKNVLDWDRPQMIVWRMCITGWIPRATATHRLCSTYCFSTATMVARMHLNITLYVHCLFGLTFKILSLVGLIVKRDA